MSKPVPKKRLTECFCVTITNDTPRPLRQSVIFYPVIPRPRPGQRPVRPPLAEESTGVGELAEGDRGNISGNGFVEIASRTFGSCSRVGGHRGSQTIHDCMPVTKASYLKRSGVGPGLGDTE